MLIFHGGSTDTAQDRNPANWISGGYPGRIPCKYPGIKKFLFFYFIHPGLHIIEIHRGIFPAVRDFRSFWSDAKFFLSHMFAFDLTCGNGFFLPGSPLPRSCHSGVDRYQPGIIPAAPGDTAHITHRWNGCIDRSDFFRELLRHKLT